MTTGTRDESASSVPRIESVAEWPRISVVTPSYNQGAYIGETIRSVLEQDYPHVEYIITDGGSTDETVAVIRQYEDRIHYWVSEPDRGQTHAIAKGWEQATGQIICWLNSDDWYYPGALATVARTFVENPGLQWLNGGVLNGYDADSIHHEHVPSNSSLAECLGRRKYGFHQPGMFWTPQLLEQAGPLDESLHFCFDHDLWCRALAAGIEPLRVPQPFTFFRLHRESKTCSRRSEFLREDWVIFRRYQDKLSPGERRQAREWLRTYDVGYLVDVIYELLSQKGRVSALAYLLKRLPLIRLAPDKRAVVGALARVLGSGRCPDWWKTQL